MICSEPAPLRIVSHYISTHCDKPILEILEMKTRAQKWPDIAEELGLLREVCFGEKK